MQSGKCQGELFQSVLYSHMVTAWLLLLWVINNLYITDCEYNFLNKYFQTLGDRKSVV